MHNELVIREEDMPEARRQALDGNKICIAYYIYGLIERGRAEEAMQFGQLCISNNQLFAGSVIADQFYSANGLTPDPNKWLTNMKLGAEDSGLEGAECAYQLGEHFFADSQYQEALRWFQHAVERGLDEAAVAIGFLYEEGNGMPRDLLKAARWFMKVRDLPDSGAARSIPYADWPVQHGTGWVGTAKLRQYLAELPPEERGELIKLVGPAALAACDTAFCSR